MTIVAENQVKLNCFPPQFRPKTVLGKKLKRTFKRLLDASEDNSCESTINILDFGSFERNVPLNEYMPAMSKKRRLEISGLGEKKHKLESNLKLQHMKPDDPCERSAEQNHCGDSRLVHEVKHPSQSLSSPSGLGSDGGVISEADNFRPSTPASIEAPMSPKKALRAAMLKKRFVDTIFKATHRESVKSDRLGLQQERERLQQERRKENVKLEALLKAAEEAFRRGQQHNLMMQRENERKAAKIFFDKVEKSVELDDNMSMLNNMKMIGYDYLYYPLDHGYRLEDVDEGEILSWY